MYKLFFKRKEAELLCEDTLQKYQQIWLLNQPDEGSLVRFVGPMGFFRHQAFGGLLKEPEPLLNLHPDGQSG